MCGVDLRECRPAGTTGRDAGTARVGDCVGWGRADGHRERRRVRSRPCSVPAQTPPRAALAAPLNLRLSDGTDMARSMRHAHRAMDHFSHGDSGRIPDDRRVCLYGTGRRLVPYRRLRSYRNNADRLDAERLPPRAIPPARTFCCALFPFLWFGNGRDELRPTTLFDTCRVVSCHGRHPRQCSTSSLR